MPANETVTSLVDGQAKRALTARGHLFKSGLRPELRLGLAVM